MPPGKEHPALEALQARLRDEEAAYGEVLGVLDRLADFPLPAESAPEVREKLARLNALWAAPERPAYSGLGGAVQGRAWDALAPALERQAEFNAALVQLLNAHLAPVEQLHAHLRELAGALVRYAQRLQPLVDAGDRATSALATTRSELVLESFDRRLESLSRRLDGLMALRDHLEELGRRSPANASGDDVLEHPADRAAHFRECAPVVDLGCGRGELLEALRKEGIDSLGVDSDAGALRECREKGLEVSEADLLEHLRGRPDGGLGGVHGARVAGRMEPAVLAALVAESHRVLRPGGRLVLGTDVDGAPGPDTLRFLATAAGFGDVRVEAGALVARR